MARCLSGVRGGGWPLVTAAAFGVLIGRFAVSRRESRQDVRSAEPQPRRQPQPVIPPRPVIPSRPAAQAAEALWPAMPPQGAGLLAGDDELLKLADREEAWW